MARFRFLAVLFIAARRARGGQRSAKAPSRGARLRLLPAVIVAALCMLGLRVQVVVQNIAHARHATLQVAQAAALAATTAPAQAAGQTAAQSRPRNGRRHAGAARRCRAAAGG